MDFTNIEESKPDGEQPLKFYYNREERLEKAPQVVQDFYSGKIKANKGIKAIFANKSNRFMLGTVAVLTAFVWLYQGVFAKKNTVVINDIKYELQAFSYADEVYSTIKISSKKSAVLKEPLNIDADVFVINADNQIIDKEHLSLVYSDGEQYMHAKTTDFDVKRIDVLLTVADETCELTAVVKK